MCGSDFNPSPRWTPRDVAGLTVLDKDEGLHRQMSIQRWVTESLPYMDCPTLAYQNLWFMDTCRNTHGTVNRCRRYRTAGTYFCLEAAVTDDTRNGIREGSTTAEELVAGVDDS